MKVVEIVMEETVKVHINEILFGLMPEEGNNCCCMYQLIKQSKVARRLLRKRKFSTCCVDPKKAFERVT